MRCVVFTFFQHPPPPFPTVMLLKMFSPNKEGYTMGLTQIHLTLYTASLSMQSFWVVLLFLRKQMLRILKHTFADQHPPPPLVSLVHPPPPPQQDVRIISCTYKEVCSCQLVKYMYIYLVCSYSPSSHVIIIKRERESPITLIISWSKTSVNINYQQFKYYVKTWDQSFITLVITHWIY